ncbi:hypothetical protein BUAKA3JSW_00517 [Bacteroides uniformis]|uniref:hypothetical protein n=1 Tax=Bacteroides uniformis TaxID=820 RepID=UPI0020158DD7|nr:hypothetical protein [Bacteroides uniformis]CAH2755635.1 hypothetical protein BUAKA3JSW_00517 [Bacteroides uniformis]
MRKTKWIIYTVLIGLMPFLIRLFVFMLSANREWGLLFNPVDFIFLGLTLNLTNLNELNNEKLEPILKLKFEGYSVIQIILLSGILGILYFAEQSQKDILDKTIALVCAIAFCLLSFIFSNAIMNKLNSLDDGND